MHWLRNPIRLGAVVPSSSMLTSSLAAQIDTAAPGSIVELGAGTGCVTEALLKAGVPPHQLLAVERNHSFCDRLSRRFPGVMVVEGEAETLEQITHQYATGPIKAVVSSLPLRAMPNKIRRTILSQVFSILNADGTYVQFTYGLAAPVPSEIALQLGITGKRANWVLANLPPAAIWLYRREDRRLNCFHEARRLSQHSFP